MSAGTAIAVGAGVAAVGGIASSAISANAAGNAGLAQLTAAQQQVAFARDALQAQIQARAQGIQQAQAAAQMSPGEIASINQLLTTRDTALNQSLASIQKQQATLDQIDPNVRASGQDLYDLLTGKSAAILQPLQTQLNYQRQNLVSQLSSQMGPGWMTSSAGIQAITQFDNQASLSLNQAQMQAITTVGSQFGALSGLEQQGQAGVTGATQNAFQGAEAATGMAAQAFAQNTQLQTNATLGAMSANPLNPFGVPNAQGSVVAAAPGQFAGQAMMGQGLGQATSGIANIFGQYGAMQNFGQMLTANGGGGGGVPLSTQIGSYQLPSAGGASLNPFYQGGAGGGYSGMLGANVQLQ